MVLNKHSIHVPYIETHNNADYNNIFQRFSILRTNTIPINKNENKEKAVRTGLNMLNMFNNIQPESNSSPHTL